MRVDNIWQLWSELKLRPADKCIYCKCSIGNHFWNDHDLHVHCKQCINCNVLDIKFYNDYKKILEDKKLAPNPINSLLQGLQTTGLINNPSYGNITVGPIGQQSSIPPPGFYNAQVLCAKCMHPAADHIDQFVTKASICLASGCTCEITDKELLNAPAGGLTTTMPIKSRLDFKSSVAKLAPIYREIQEKVFLGQNEFSIVGPGVRDSLFGGLNRHYDIQTAYGNMDTDQGLYGKLLRAHLDQWRSDEDEELYNLETKFGNITFSWNWKWKPYWSFDDAGFILDPQPRHYYDSANILSTTKEAWLQDKSRIKTAAQAGEQLKYAIDVCARYGWHIREESMQYLAGIIEQDAPLPEVNETIIGFRAYNISEGYLQGARGVKWATNQLSVDCENFTHHIKQSYTNMSGGIVRGKNGEEVHPCGIYIFKDPVECVHFYGIGSKMHAIAAVVGWGDFWEGDRGYRVEHARIEKLWVIKDGIQLRPYDIPGGVLMNAKIGDFYKDIYSTGIDFENKNSLI